MYAMIGEDVFRLKVDVSNQAGFEAKGIKPYTSGKKKKGMPHWEVPPDIIEDREQIKIWDDKAYTMGLKSK